MKKLFSLGLSGALLFSIANVYALNSTTATVNDQTSIGITIYNNNLALIKDTRHISLKSGKNRLLFEDVSALIRPETASLSVKGGNVELKLIEQNFDYDLLTPQKLLEKYVGRDIKFIRTNKATGEEKTLRATVLATNNGVVLQVGNHIETGMPERIMFPDVPANLRSKPTLVIDLIQPQADKQTLELSYLSTGLSWRADYIAKINQQETQIDLNAWVTLNNQSGNSYHNAKLQLVAGDVNQVSGRSRYDRSLRKESVSLDSVTKFNQESLLDFHLYSLENKTDILNNQTKQVALFSRNKIPVTKTYHLTGSNYYYRNKYGVIDKKTNPNIILSFKNNKASNLALPLPKGIVRSYKNDSNNNLQFVGEDRIEHTAKNETVKLKLGKAFDISTSKKQLNYKVLSKSTHNRLLTEADYEISIRNAKESEITLNINEPIPGDWKILKENIKHVKTNANTAQWQISVPANGKATLKYRVRIQH